jgi:DNA mismatch repair protein MutL
LSRDTGAADAVRGRGEPPLPDYLRRRPAPPLAARGLEGEVAPAAENRIFEPRPRPVFDLARGRSASNAAREATASSADTTADSANAVPGRAEQSSLPGLPLLRLVGQLRSAFIVAEGPAGLVLVDQHAAHERVLYERFLAGSQGGPEDAEGTALEGRQELLDPPLIELTPSAAAAWDAHAASLLGAGFVCEEFGDRVLRLRAVPAALGERDARATLQAVLDELAGEERAVRQNDPALASAACHAAVRAGKSLSQEEMRALLRDLESCENPHTCPHGRPVVVQFELSELERRFGR